MPRWRLTEPHHLNVPECFWEQTETDRDTGRKKIRKHLVPMYLDPNDPSCWTERTGLDIRMGGNQQADGAIFIFQGERTNPRDLEFIGEVTPGMEPLDDEAKKITEATCEKYGWLKPKDERSFADTMLEKLADRSNYIDPSISAMQEQIRDMMQIMVKFTEQNVSLMQAIAAKQHRDESIGRRV